MLLIFEQQRSLFGKRLSRAAEKREYRVWWLDAQEVVSDLLIRFHLDTVSTRIVLCYREEMAEADAIAGVYNTIDYFPAAGFDFLTAKDREYAASEWHALWLGLLHAFACPVINPPAVDALGGTAPSIAELFMQARRCGLRTPTIAELESGLVAAGLAGTDARLTAADLGGEVPEEVPLHAAVLRAYPLSQHHIRVREYFQAPTFRIAVIGKVCHPSAGPSDADDFVLAPSLEKRLLKLHEVLGLKVAEYHLYKTEADGWVLFDMNRSPSPASMRLLGERLVSETLDLIERR